MYHNHKQGFTLIELLVVIAIIGILSAVVLASLNTARSKGSDAAIMSDIGGIRTQAQLYFNNNNSYGPVGVTVSDCTAGLFGDPTVAKQVQAAETANGPIGVVTCNLSTDGTAYAVSAALVSTPDTSYCVDSVGTGTTTTKVLGTDTNC